MAFFTKENQVKTVSFISSEECCFDTGLKLCCGRTLSCKEFVKIQKYNFFHKIVFDCYNRLTGIDEELDRLLISNKFSYKNCINGLLQFIIEALVENSDKRLAVVNLDKLNISEYYNQYCKSLEENIKVITTSIDYSTEDEQICLLFNNNKLSHLLDVLFQIQFNIFSGMNTGASMSNAVLFQKYGLNTANPNLRDRMRADLNLVKQALKSFNTNFGLIDSEDKLTLIQPIKDTYSEYIKVIDSMIASATSLPISYINGVLSGSLSTTGEGDIVQTDHALKNFYNMYIKDYINILCLIINYDFTKISFMNDVTGRFTDFAQYIPNLETTNLLPERRKKEILYNAIGYNEEQLQQDIEENIQEDIEEDQEEIELQ